MTVFKTYLKIVKSYKLVILMYTVMLLFFTGINMQTSETSTSFSEAKPSIYIINHDQSDLSKNMVEYLSNQCEIVDINEDLLEDALFYRDVHYIIEIPENYGNSFMDGNEIALDVKGTGTYESTLAKMVLERYTKVAHIYQEDFDNQTDLIQSIDNTLDNESEVIVDSKTDTSALSKGALFFNFLNYSLIAGCVYIICLILASFKEKNVSNRTKISCKSERTFTTQLLVANGMFAFVLWLFYVILGVIMVGDVMFTTQGLLMILNSFVFMICCLTMAFLIGNVLSNKNAINGIINVVGIGSSFLCGAFVSASLLPDFVLAIAHVLPSYWYIYNNDTLKDLQNVSFESVQPILMNMGIILLFSLLFVVITLIVIRRKRNIA